MSTRNRQIKRVLIDYAENGTLTRMTSSPNLSAVLIDHAENGTPDPRTRRCAYR